MKLTVNGRTQQVGLDEELHAFRRGHGQQSNIGEIIAVHIDKAFIRDGVYNTALARPIARAGRRGDYFEMTPETMFENGPAGLTARLHSGAVDREPPNSCIAGVPRKRQGSARMLSRTKSSKRVGWRAKSCGGGESVSQSPLKDNAFSTFLDQNPPFELPPKWNSAFDKLSRPMARHRHCSAHGDQVFGHARTTSGYPLNRSRVWTSALLLCFFTNQPMYSVGHVRYRPSWML